MKDYTLWDVIVETRSLPFLWLVMLVKKMSFQAISMKDLNVVYLKIMDKIKYNIMISETDGEAILHVNQSEIQEKRCNESL